MSEKETSETQAGSVQGAVRLPFLDSLEESVVVLLDGGVGTELYNRGFYLNECYDALNLMAAKGVTEIHQAYARAGARVITTNTFGANRNKLSKHGFEEELHQINVVGASLARQAAGEGLHVAGSVGPLGLRVEPFGPTSEREAREMFAEQMRGLLEGGVDLFVIETISDLVEMREAIRAAHGLPVLASMTVGDDGRSLYGTTAEVFASRLDEWGADIIGVNCSVGPRPMLETLERMLSVTEKPISVQPNAGAPRLHDGRQIYLASAEYMAPDWSAAAVAPRLSTSEPCGMPSVCRCPAPAPSSSWIICPRSSPAPSASRRCRSETSLLSPSALSTSAFR